MDNAVFSDARPACKPLSLGGLNLWHPLDIVIANLLPHIISNHAIRETWLGRAECQFEEKPHRPGLSRS